jgi:hypothetical protein
MKILGENLIVLDAIFISAVIIFSMFAYVFIMPRAVQPIFPMWVLDGHQRAAKSQMAVLTNESSLFYIGVENKMNGSEYCEIQVKFRNLSMSIPNTANVTFAPLDSILNYRFFLAKDETWETPFEFNFTGEELNSSFILHDIKINNKLYEINLQSNWIEEFNGYTYQFIFELWLFEKTKEEFSFSGVWVTSPFLYIASNQTINDAMEST